MMVWLILTLLALAQTALVGSVLVPWVLRHSGSLGLLDRPGLARKLHSTPIPRSGGVAIFGAFWICLWVDFFLAATVVPALGFLPDSVRTLASNVWLKADQLEAVFIGCTIIFSLGLLDDRFSLPAKTRLLIQILACVPLLMSGVVLKLFLPPVLSYPLTIFWIVLLTNSFNFLDNMNGLTSGVSMIICGVLAVIAGLAGEWYMLLLFAMMAGAVYPFWRRNFPRAELFLGDCGSTHLGFFLGAMTILSTYYQAGVPTKLPVVMPLIVLGVPLFDTLSVLWIRFRQGQPLMEGDTNHISHRLVALGMSQKEAVLFLYGATLVVGIAAIPLRNLDWRHGFLQAIVIFLIFFLLHWLERVSYRSKVQTNH